MRAGKGRAACEFGFFVQVRPVPFFPSVPSPSANETTFTVELRRFSLTSALSLSHFIVQEGESLFSHGLLLLLFPSSSSLPLVLFLILMISLTHLQDDDNTGHLQKMRVQVGSFWPVAMGIFIVAQISLLYDGFRCSYRRGTCFFH
jgi:hypothetical protein